MNGKVEEIVISNVGGKDPLKGNELKNLKTFLEFYADAIVKKWIDYFVYHRDVNFERITKKLWPMRIIEKYTYQPRKGNLFISDANYIGDFAIRVTFNNGQSKLVDFKPFLKKAKHPALRKYLEEDQFKNFQVVNGNLDWNDFDMCFPISDIYRNAILKEEKEPYNL